jgi:hypothetical protein
MTNRRLDALNGYVFPVSTIVPPPQTPKGLMDQASALAIKLRQWKGKKSESKAMRQRRLLAVAEGRQPSTSIADLSDRRARRAERRARKGRTGGAHARRLKSKVAKADRLEYITTDMLVWIVLMNADQGESMPIDQKLGKSPFPFFLPRYH